jgi:hypothetical protein
VGFGSDSVFSCPPTRAACSFVPAAHYFKDAHGPGYDAAAACGRIRRRRDGNAGAVPTIWYDLRGLAKDRQRGLVQPYITAMQITALAILAARRGVPDVLIDNLVFSLAPLAGGTLIGLALFGKVREGPSGASFWVACCYPA